jgi:hypothetical protein
LADIKLFKLQVDSVRELPAEAVDIEKQLQLLMEQHLESFLGVRFLASEYATTDGRIDTLGLDDNDCPVIIEFKRSMDPAVIIQGLSYLTWLGHHRGDFTEVVRKKLDEKWSGEVDWPGARLLCIAGDFGRHDEQAVKQTGNTELLRYRLYGDDLLMLELVHVPQGSPREGRSHIVGATRKRSAVRAIRWRSSMIDVSAASSFAAQSTLCVLFEE